MASGSSKEYRLVIGADFTADWDHFVLQCRREGQTPDAVIKTLVLESLGTPAPGPRKGATPLSQATRNGHAEKEKEPAEKDTRAAEPDKPTRHTKKTRKPAKLTAKRTAKRPQGGSNKEASGHPRPVPADLKGKGRNASRKGSPPKRRLRHAHPRSHPGKPGPVDLPPLQAERGPPRPRDKDGLSLAGPEPSPDPSAPAQPPTIELQLPSNTTPKFKLLELLRQIDLDHLGVERDEVLRQARSNNIEDPETTLNKLIRRGLVHIYQGRCRTG